MPDNLIVPPVFYVFFSKKVPFLFRNCLNLNTDFAQVQTELTKKPVNYSEKHHPKNILSDGSSSQIGLHLGSYLSLPPVRAGISSLSCFKYVRSLFGVITITGLRICARHLRANLRACLPPSENSQPELSHAVCLEVRTGREQERSAQLSIHRGSISSILLCRCQNCRTIP